MNVWLNTLPTNAKKTQNIVDDIFRFNKLKGGRTYKYAPCPYEEIDGLSAFIDSTHILIAGTTGCGKSTLIDDIMYNLLTFRAPVGANGMRLVLIDPKMVELSKYNALPHTWMYADNNEDTIKALDVVIDNMMNRYEEMRSKGLQKYDGSHIYVIVDELGDLMTTCQKEALPRLQRIAQLGRASKIHLICASQSPSAKVIKSELSLNFTDLVGMRCRTAIQSRQIIGESGCEYLPQYGKALYLCAGELNQIDVPLMPKTQLNKTIQYWIDEHKKNM